MISHSNTQKLLLREKSRLGRRDAQRAGGEEAKEMSLNLRSPEGPQPVPCRAIAVTWQSLVTVVFGRRWKFQRFAYTWLPGWQLCSEKLLPVVASLPKPDTVQGPDSFTAGRGWPEAHLRIWPGTSRDSSFRVWGNLAQVEELSLSLFLLSVIWKWMLISQENWVVSWYFDLKLA